MGSGRDWGRGRRVEKRVGEGELGKGGEEKVEGEGGWGGERG